LKHFIQQATASFIRHRADKLADRRDHVTALRWYERALRLRPEDASTHYKVGNALMALNRPAEAALSYRDALKRRADYGDAYYNRGLANLALKRNAEALSDFDDALRLAPHDAGALNNRGNVLLDLKRTEEALISYQRAIAANPRYADALHNLAVAQFDLKRPEDAAISLSSLLELSPDYPFAKGKLLHAKMVACNWRGLQQIGTAVAADLQQGKRAAQPFGYQAFATFPRNLHACARIYADAFYPASRTPYWQGERYGHSKIRVGYLGGEFRDHATALLAVKLFELHDKSRFETYAFDSGWDDGSEMRRRTLRAFDEFISIADLSDDAAAELIRRKEIDILVNLNGYFGQARTGVFARRAAPVQVNYLGFPGTLGANYMDYIIADRHVIPLDEQSHYSEQVVYMPDSYQVNDSSRGIAPIVPTRSEAGLPLNAFVFCCFNNNYKITPEFFDIWMRLLKKIPASVLWLFEDNAAVPANLRRVAAEHGIAAERLVFAKRAAHAGHLARHRLADLFLDTLPYNAHTTASDALWSGLPLITCRGTTFPGRVATSLLTAIGLPQLVTESIAEYEALAFKLATTPSLLAAVREQLARNLSLKPLFDTQRYCRHLESAFVQMRERHERGESPAGFAVTPMGET
jgi:protein O-GlcNAc transferase